MGSAEVQSFLTMLATVRQVSPSTHRQALNALLFFYRNLVGLDLPWMQDIGHPPVRKRIPVVPSVVIHSLKSVFAPELSQANARHATRHVCALRLDSEASPSFLIWSNSSGTLPSQPRQKRRVM